MERSKIVTVISCNILISICIIGLFGLSQVLDQRREASTEREGKMLVGAVLAERELERFTWLSLK